MQTTFDGIGRAWTWNNLDLRAATVTKLGDKDVVVGLTLNNSPQVQDASNTLPAWGGFPDTNPALAPSSSASPLLMSGLAKNTLGCRATLGSTRLTTPS